MFGIIYLFLTIAASFFIIRRLGSTVFQSGREALVVSVPFGITVSSLLASAFSFVLPMGSAAGVSLGIMILVAAVLWMRGGRGIKLWTGFGKELYWIAGVVVVLGLFLCFLQSRTLTGNIQTRIPRNASVDVVYHLSQVERVAQSQNWHFEEPNFAGEFIRYPYLINQFSGVMLKFGSVLTAAYHIPVFLLIFALLYGLLALCRALGLARWQSVLVTILVLFGGGLAYIYHYNFNADAISIAFPQQHINYAGLVASFLTVQRAFVLGLPLLLFSLLAFVRGVREENLTAWKWAGFLFGLLPFAHSHSFFAGGIFYTVVLLYYIIRRNPMAFDFIRGVVFYGTFTAIVPLIIMLIAPQYNLGGVPLLRFGWMTSATEVGRLNLPFPGASKFYPWIVFMITNFGALLLLPLLSLSGIRRRAGDAYYIFMFGGLALWLIPNLVQLQTWDFDTNKLFIYAVLFSGIAAALAINTWTGWAKKAGFAILFLIMVAGLPIPVMKLRGIMVNAKNTVSEFTPEQRAASNWLRANSGDDAVVLSGAAVNPTEESLLNGVTIGAGRTATVGYITWLYTHGIDYNDRLMKVQDFFKTGKKEALEGVPADFLVVDNLLNVQYPALEGQLAAQGLKPAYSQNGISIYKLK
jgi:hypothetical protein